MTGLAGMADEKVTILGGKGMLGSDVSGLCRLKNINFESFDLPEFDITNYEQLAGILQKSDLVINCAAYTDVEGAEEQKEQAFKINAEAVGRLGKIAKEIGLWVLHISTDFVFDGRAKRPYTETDEPNPINAYGQSKLAGEQLLVASGCRCCIIRTEWTYGLGGNNFITKLIRNASDKNELKIVDDQIGSPTATEEAAKMILKLASLKQEGLFHFAAEGFASRFEMAGFILNKLNLPVKLRSCKTKDFPSAAKRPLNSRFDCSKISKLLDEPIERWERPLERFLEKLTKKGFHK
jgi:dTDP-4-dehydrorhamnose reductase